MSFTIEQLQLGQKEFFEQTYTESDVLSFAEISGDNNPVHMSESAAQKTVFKHRVVHGALVSSAISALLGARMPGEGTIYLGQETKFVAPVFIGDTVFVTCEVIEIIKRKNIAILSCILVNQHGNIVLEGKATVMPPKEPI